MARVVAAGLIVMVLLVPPAFSAQRYSRQEAAQRIRDAVARAESTPPSAEELAESEVTRRRFIEVRLSEVRSRIADGRTDTPLFHLLIRDLISAGASNEVKALGVPVQ